MKATLSSLYTLLPLTCYRRSAPFDRRQCKMAWITERNLSKAASFHSLIEFLWESSLPPDAQEAILAEGGAPTSSCRRWSQWTWLLSATEPWRASGKRDSCPRSHRRAQPEKKTESHRYYLSWPNTHSFPVAMAISGPLPTWQTSDFRGERRVPVRDYSLRHFPHQVELQAVTDASVCCHLSLGPLKSRPEFHVLILSYVTDLTFLRKVKTSLCNALLFWWNTTDFSRGHKFIPCFNEVVHVTVMNGALSDCYQGTVCWLF